MKDNKQYAGVAEMLDDILSEDPQLNDELDKFIHDRQVVKCLAATRCANGLSQKDIADKLGCSQSYVSKLESGLDCDLKIGEIEKYLDVLGIDSILLLKPKNQTAIDSIKFHAYKIKTGLEELASLASGDDESAKRVAKTHFDTLLGLVRIVSTSAEKIPVDPITNRPFCRVELNLSESHDVDFCDDSSGCGSAS